MKRDEHPIVQASFSALHLAHDGSLALDDASKAKLEAALAVLPVVELATVAASLATLVQVLRTELASPNAAAALLDVVDRATSRLESTAGETRRTAYRQFRAMLPQMLART